MTSRKKRKRLTDAQAPESDLGHDTAALRHRTRVDRLLSGIRRRHVLEQRVIDTMLLTSEITERTHQTLTDVFRDIYFSNMIGPRAASYEPRVSSSPSDMSARQMLALRRVNQAFDMVAARFGAATATGLRYLLINDVRPHPALPLNAIAELLDMVLYEPHASRRTRERAGLPRRRHPVL